MCIYPNSVPKAFPRVSNSFYSGNTLFAAGAQPSLVTLFGSYLVIKLRPHRIRPPCGPRTMSPPELPIPRTQHSEGIQ